MRTALCLGLGWAAVAAAQEPSGGAASPAADVASPASSGGHAEEAAVFAAWAERARDELEMDGFRPHRVVVAAMSYDRWQVSADFGALFSENEQVGRAGVVEVVVGSDALDSSRFSGRNQPSGGARSKPNFVVEDVEAALARDLWLTTDASFKDAVQRYQVKAAALAQSPVPWPADWAPQGGAPVVDLHPDDPPLQVDHGALRELVAASASVFREFPELRNGWVELAVQDADVTLVTTEGTRLVQPERHVSLHAWCDALRGDGVRVYDEAMWLVDGPGRLPDVGTLQAALRAMGQRVTARASAPVVDDYVGPVVFEGRAVAQLFIALLGGELEGTPPEPRANTTYEQLLRGGPRVGRRLLPEGWSVVDDPTAYPVGAPGAYRYDREGVPGEAVEVVRDGYAVDLLMSRVPRRDLTRSNGHARGAFQGNWEARLTAWTVTPPRAASAGGFRRAVEHARRGAGLDRVLVVRALQRGRTGALPQVLDAVWRYADGREEPVVALEFIDTDRRTLRDLVVAGPGASAWPYLAALSRGGAEGTTLGLPSVVRAPGAVLVGELEATFPGSDTEPDAYPMPRFAEGTP
jgi:hypothetical protein